MRDSNRIDARRRWWGGGQDDMAAVAIRPTPAPSPLRRHQPSGWQAPADRDDVQQGIIACKITAHAADAAKATRVPGVSIMRR